MTYGIKTLFRKFSNISSSTLTDEEFENDIFPASVDYLEKVFDEDISYSNFPDDPTTDDATVDRIIAQICSYYAYLNYFQHRIDKESGFYIYEIHRQHALSLISVYKPECVKFNSKTGNYSIVDRDDDTPSNVILHADGRVIADEG